MGVKTEKIIKMGKFKIRIAESGEDPPLGIIIDIWNLDTNKLVESYTLWDSDY